MKCLWFFLMVAFAAGSKTPVEEFVENNNDLSINMFYELIKIRQDNFVYGIFCLDAIMALTCLGSTGDTAAEIKKAFDWNVPDSDLTSAFETAIHELKNVKNLNIHLTNKIYVDNNIKIDQKFHKIAEAFDTSIENVNFNDAQESAQKINSWVSGQTAKKIDGMIHEKHFNALTNMVLINSLYFRGRWNHPFELNETKKMDFYLSKNETVQMDMMKVTGHFLVDKNPTLGIRMLRIPYQNKKADLIIMLPDDIDGFHRVEKDARKLWKERNFNRQHTTLYLPKFKVESSIDMILIMKNMGVSKLFSSADLSGITHQDVNVSAIIQKISVGVDEIGTESDSTVPDVGAHEEIIDNSSQKVEVFKADHPFLFAIVYDGFSLLVGRYSGPKNQ